LQVHHARLQANIGDALMMIGPFSSRDACVFIYIYLQLIYGKYGLSACAIMPLLLLSTLGMSGAHF